jgi:hypothetical protein
LATARTTVSTSRRLTTSFLAEPVQVSLICSREFLSASRKAIPTQTSPQKAINESKNIDSQLQRGAQHGQRSAATQLVQTSSTHDDALSILTFIDLNDQLSPLGSLRPQYQPLLLTADGFSIVANNKKMRDQSASLFF